MNGQRGTGPVRTFVDRTRKLFAVLANRRFRSALLHHRVAASTEHSAVPFDEARTIVDVGANRGQFTLFALERFPTANVHSIEPHPGALKVLERVAATDPRVRVYRTAAGATRHEAVLQLSNEDDSSSFLPVNERYLRVWPNTFTIGSDQVQVERLDGLLAQRDLIPPALMKIDVQGTELEVLRGTGEMLGDFNEVFVECSFTELYDGQALADDVIGYLRERGLRLVGIYAPAYDALGNALQADLLFRRL